jgi:putative FmdB family regulatory protein
VPTYGYRCPVCATEFDVWQKMTDPPGATCPSCGAAATRLFFPAGIVFKGNGFYVTDSRKAASGSSSSNGAPAGPKASDAKPAPGKESAAKDSPGKSSPSGGASSTASTSTTS